MNKRKDLLDNIDNAREAYRKLEKIVTSSKTYNWEIAKALGELELVLKQYLDFCEKINEGEW